MFRVSDGSDGTRAIGGSPKKTSVMSALKQVYTDPFKWSLVKGLVAFAGGIYLARVISDEWDHTSAIV